MRDAVAGVVALLLMLLAASLATTLKYARQRRQRARDSERALGRTVIVEIPGEDDLVLFSEDAVRFYYGDRSIDKDLIVSARLLINGNTIAEARSQGKVQERTEQGTDERDGRAAKAEAPEAPEDVEAVEETGIVRDRWDVAIQAVNGALVVPCGAIRERVSQELARSVFDAVKRDINARDARVHHSVSGAPPR
jgi:hypothetical protein